MGNGNGASPDGSALRIELHHDLVDIDASEWDALLARCSEPTPFLRHAFLQALHRSGSATARTGWQPLVLTVRAPGPNPPPDSPGGLTGACLLYVKSHSWGEYVFDWAWANAYERSGLAYYPKLLGAVPFTPVPGTRLLATDDATRALLLQAIRQLVEDRGWSSAHLLFLSEEDRRAAQTAGWLMRTTVQFHWQNRHVARPGSAPYVDFADFLADLTRDKRKKAQQERRYVREAGITFEAKRGPEITSDDWDHFYTCYVRTYRAHASTPYLTRSFFDQVASALPEHWLMFVAQREGERVASSLVALDPEHRTAYGRYWGCTEEIPHLHFSACYHEPLDWCIREGWHRFEGGAQGEHKMARGLMPVETHSAHWLSHPQFADAVARHLEREAVGMDAYVQSLEARTPFKSS